MPVKYQILSLFPSGAEISKDKPPEWLCWVKPKEELGDLGFISKIVFQCIAPNEPLLEPPMGQWFPQQTSETGETLEHHSAEHLK